MNKFEKFKNMVNNMTLEEFATYMDDNLTLDYKCDSCAYEVCDEHDNCKDGIIEYLKINCDN